MHYDSRAIIRVWLRETTSAVARAAHLALFFVLSLLSLGSFCSAVSAVQRALSHSILCFLFSSIVHGGVLRRSLQEHDGAIATTPKASLRKHNELPLNLR